MNINTATDKFADLKNATFDNQTKQITGNIYNSQNHGFPDGKYIKIISILDYCDQNNSLLIRSRTHVYTVKSFKENSKGRSEMSEFLRIHCLARV